MTITASDIASNVQAILNDGLIQTTIITFTAILIARLLISMLRLLISDFHIQDYSDTDTSTTVTEEDYQHLLKKYPTPVYYCGYCGGKRVWGQEKCPNCGAPYDKE